jgi:DNA-directed RNA polymerase beta' subunit
VCKVDTSDTYEKGRPKAGGLSDLRMGTMDRGTICTTDGSNSMDCPGYFGHIELAKPMYHIGFLRTIIRVLRCVSYHTSKLLINKVRAHACGPAHACNSGIEQGGAVQGLDRLVVLKTPVSGAKRRRSWARRPVKGQITCGPGGGEGGRGP